MEFITKNTQETQRAARDLVERLNKLVRAGALVLALRGELGAGKTTFVQGLAKALGVKEKILSPTFVLMKRFKLSGCSIDQLGNFYHLDAYRLADQRDLKELGVKEIMKNSKNLVVIEWAERVAEALPSDAVWIEFRHKGGDLREIKIY